MMNLENDVKYIKGVGPNRVQSLNKYICNIIIIFFVI